MTTTKPGSDRALALWYVSRGLVDLREVAISPPTSGEALVSTHCSALSRGTERLVYSGRVPAGEQERMRAPFQEGAFPFPVKYGYCAVGAVEEGPADLVGRLVFCLHPHQTRFTVPVSMLTPVPDRVPARRAVLAANMETALNGIWDSGIAPGDRVNVIGAGIVGLLVARLAAGIPGTQVTVVDVDSARRPIAQAFGCRFSRPLDAPEDVDVVIHCSATAQGLACALATAGEEARIVEMSWYGAGAPPVPLGLAFHSRRLSLVSSQVGQIPPARRPRWTHARRLAKAMELLADDALDALLTNEVRFSDLPAAIDGLLAPGAPGLATIITYD